MPSYDWGFVRSESEDVTVATVSCYNDSEEEKRESRLNGAEPPMTRANADFIRFSRTDIPALVATVRELRAALEYVRDNLPGVGVTRGTLEMDLEDMADYVTAALAVAESAAGEGE